VSREGCIEEQEIPGVALAVMIIAVGAEPSGLLPMQVMLAFEALILALPAEASYVVRDGSTLLEA
jgi:hypothetical protein